MDEPRDPVGPEIDDSGNPTAASPDDLRSSATDDLGADTAGDTTADFGDAAEAENEPLGATGRRAISGREMLAQLQQMIDTLAVQATPVVRDVAAKAAELAAVAGQKAGPLAHRAAEATEKVGERVAVRSKEMAAELRATRAQGDAAPDPAPAESPPPSDDGETGG